MVLKPTLWNHVTSSNYDDKKARDVGLPCLYHLSNIYADNIFHESMRQGIACSLPLRLFVFLFFRIFLLSAFLLRKDASVFQRMKEMESILSL